MSTMKALQLTKKTPNKPPSLTLTTLPIPPLPPSHLLIKIHASAIQPSDLLNSHGLLPQTTYPRIPGRDFSGTIVSGPASSLGKEVYGSSGSQQSFTTDGAHAEYILVPENAVAIKPRDLSFAQAAVIGVPFTTAMVALQRAGAKGGDVVLVLGARGAVGAAVVQVARGMGCRVLEGMRGGGDVRTDEDPGLEIIDSLTGGKGVDVVIDTVGQPALTKAAITKLGRGGTLVFISAPPGGGELVLDMKDFYRGERRVVGVNTLLCEAGEVAGVLEEVRRMFDEGLLRAGREWEEVRLEDGVEAYERAGQRGAGKFVIVME